MLLMLSGMHVFCFSSPVSQEVVSPRSTSSGSRKKRRRKTSQSESKALSPPPKSPESLTPRAEDKQKLDSVDTPQHSLAKQAQERDMPRTKLISRFNKTNPPSNEQVLIIDAEVGNSQQIPTRVQETSPPPAPLPSKHVWSHSPSRYLTNIIHIAAANEIHMYSSLLRNSTFVSNLGVCVYPDSHKTT